MSAINRKLGQRHCTAQARIPALHARTVLTFVSVGSATRLM